MLQQKMQEIQEMLKETNKRKLLTENSDKGQNEQVNQMKTDFKDA